MGKEKPIFLSTLISKTVDQGKETLREDVGSGKTKDVGAVIAKDSSGSVSIEKLLISSKTDDSERRIELCS
ncbi:hypothetical protein V6N13_102460 [Hibiscus sabdariffa]